MSPSIPSPDAPAPPFRAVLLDDHGEDREHFRFLLRRHPSIELVGEATSLQAALELIDRESAHLLFLESEVGGLAILDDCHLIPPSVKLIFTTRDAAAAVRAFELDAIDFLLKPLLPSRLGETVRRLLRIDWPRATPPAPIGGSILIPFERGRRGASLHEIVLVQAFGNYTRVALVDGTSEIVLRSLAKWSGLLPSPPFLRVHRNAMVHAQRVLGLDLEEGNHLLRLEGQQEKVLVSRRCLRAVREALFGEEETP